MEKTCSMEERMRFVFACETGAAEVFGIVPGYGVSRRVALRRTHPTASPPAASLGAQIARFESFQDSYNHDRPHKALGQRPPATLYRCSPRSWTDACASRATRRTPSSAASAPTARSSGRAG